MPEDLPVGRLRVLQDMHVGAAQPAGVHFHDDFIGGGHRVGDLGDFRDRPTAHNGKHLLPHRPFVVTAATGLPRACRSVLHPRACCAAGLPARAYCQLKARIVGADTPGALSLCRGTVHERLPGMGDRMTRGFGAATIVLMGCLASGTAGVGVAHASPGSPASPAAAAASGAEDGAVAAAASCEPRLDTYSRTQLCWRVGATVAVVQGATRIGTVTFELTHDIQLNPRGRDWAESITISAVKVTGSATAMTMSLRASCASPCAATDRFPQGQAITDGLTGVIDYSDTVTTGRADSAQTTYQLSFVKAGDRAAGFSYETPISYRCDDALPGVPAGCVFPAYTPYLTTLGSLVGVGYDIYQAEGGPGHYGKPGSGHPLHRVTSAATQAENYSAVCAPSVVGPPPSAGQACDEYPFRSTREGGTAVGKANRSVGWVPAAREREKNALITSFYNSNRVLNGDPFWAVV